MVKNIIKFFRRIKAEKVPGENIDSPKFIYTDYAHLYNIDNNFTDEFYANLIKTINWTEKISIGITDQSSINYSTVLRSVNPDYQGTPFYRYEAMWEGCASTPDITFNYKDVLDDVMVLRNDTHVPANDFAQLGRILEFYIDVTTHDGAPCDNSEGFVDASDIPPIDTWFYLTTTKLYCWIPAFFIEKMQNAIDVEILGSYNWIKVSNVSLHNKVKEKLRSIVE